MEHTPFTPATRRPSDNPALSSSKGSAQPSGSDHAQRASSTLPVVMEKGSAASPMRLHHSSRLRRSFERVKAQVDIDLLHFRRDLVTLLGTISDEEGMCVLPSMIGMVDTCLEQDLGTFRASCQDMVDELEELRRRCAAPAHRARITRLLFIVTRCSRLIFTEEADSGGRHQHYMTQPKGRLQKGMRHRTDIPTGGPPSSGLEAGMTPAASIRRSTTMPQRWLTDFRRPYAAAPDAERAPHRAAEDQLYSDGGPALLPPGKDFRPSPLGRSVVTALEAQLEKAARSSTLGRQTFPSPSLPSSPGAQRSMHKTQKGPLGDRKQEKLRWSPSTIAEAEGSRPDSPSSASSVPASPATPRPPAMAHLQAQHPADSSPDPSLPSTPRGGPAPGLSSEGPRAQHSRHSPVPGTPPAEPSRRAHSQPLQLPTRPAAGKASDEPEGQAPAARPASAQEQKSRLEKATQDKGPQTAQKSRPRSLTFPLPHQRHLEPSRLSPQTPLSSAPGSHAKGAMSSLAQECSSPDSRGSSSHALDSPMRGNPVCRICDEVVPAGTVQEHTQICKELDGTLCGVDSLSGRLQRLAELCEASSGAEQGPSCKALLLRLAEQCVSVASADAPSTPSRACQEALEHCKAIRNSADARQHATLYACAQRALVLVSSKVAQLSCAPSPQPSGEMLHMAGMHHTDVGIEDFEVLKPISRGAFGRVYLARKRSTGDLYAIKVMRKKDLIRKNLVENACFEKEIMSSANNAFVVRSFYSFTSKDNLYLVMEWISGGDTASLLKSMGSLDEDVARQYIAETILALEWCHSQGIIHRDIKPDNLLISAEGHIKAADFGLSCVGIIDRADNLSSDISMLDSDSAPSTPRSMSTSAASSPLRAAPFEAAPRLRISDDGARRQHWGHSASDPGHRRSSSDNARGREGSLLGLSPLKAGPTAALSAPSADRKRAMGTPDYLAPEVLLGTGHGSEVDWWSLGVVLFEFVTGCPPFNADSPEEIFDNILNRRMDWPEGGMSAECRDLIDALLQVDPDVRLGHGGASELKEHPWFAGLDWDNLARAKAAFVPQLDCESDTSYFDFKEVSMQSIIMDIGPSEPSSPASMSVDCVPAHPGLHPAAALLAGSCVSSTELPASAPQGFSDETASRSESAQQNADERTWSMAESTASAGQHDEWLPQDQCREGQEASNTQNFLNFSFKNLELLGKKNQEMMKSFNAVQEGLGGENSCEEN